MSLANNPLLQLTGKQQHLWNGFEAIFPTAKELVWAAIALGAGEVQPWSEAEITLARAGSQATYAGGLTKFEPREIEWLTSLKSRISSARRRAALAVNQELVRLYHHIGGEILERQTRQGWGAKVIDRLSADLREAFPEIKGFSSSNLKYMRYFAQVCPD